MRSHLLNEIKRQGNSLVPPDSTRRPPSLLQRAVDSLLLSHLTYSGYEYTAAVFAPEASLSDGPLASPDICAQLGLAPGALGVEGGSPLLAALTAAKRASQPLSTEDTALTPHGGGAPMRESLETKLRAVDAAAAEAKAARAPPPEFALQEHMLRYQREADDAAAKQLQAEVTRLREVETVRIRAAEKAAARAEIDRVLHEQQQWHAKQVAAMRRQEAEASEAFRKREASFEASCYEHRQRMLTELEGLRAKETQLKMEHQAKWDELKGQAELLASQKAIITRNLGHMHMPRACHHHTYSQPYAARFTRTRACLAARHLAYRHVD